MADFEFLGGHQVVKWNLFVLHSKYVHYTGAIINIIIVIPMLCCFRLSLSLSLSLPSLEITIIMTNEVGRYYILYRHM